MWPTCRPISRRRWPHWAKASAFTPPKKTLGRPSEALLRVWPAVSSGLVVHGKMPVARYVSYMPQGHTQLVTGAFQAGTLTVCQAGLSPSPAVQIVINRAGRPRQQRSEVASCS